MQEKKTENLSDLEQFAMRLRMAAIERGMNQLEIAEALGVGRSRVGQWFQGKNYPSRSLSVKLAAALDADVEFLLSGVEKNRISVVRESQGSFGQRQSQGRPRPYPTITKEPTREDVLKLVHRYLDDAEAWPGGIASAYHKLRLACDPKDFDYNPADYGDLPENPNERKDDE